MKLNRTPSLYDRVWRNNENINWATIEKFINKFDGEQLVEQTYNLFNKNDVVQGTISQQNGELEESGFWSSNYIEVVPNSPIQIKPSVGNTAVYDENFKFITGFGSDAQMPFILPSNAKYIRTTMGSASLDGKYVYIGADDRPYIEYGFKYADSVYDADFIKEINAALTEVRSIIEEQAPLEEYVNLFNKNTLVKGSISPNTGELTDSGFQSSDYIRIKPGSKIMILDTIGNGAFYDSQRRFIEGIDSSKTNPIQAPDNAHYLRTTMGSASIATKMVYMGDKIIPYHEYGAKDNASSSGDGINKVAIDSEGLPTITVPYSGEDEISLSFGHLGVNEFYHLRRISTNSFTHNVSSDFPSPYRVRAVNNPIADNEVRVTGGNHGTSGGEGFRTGEPVSIKTYIDGKELTSGAHSTDKEITVVCRNKACGYNTINFDTGQRRDIIEEVVTYRFVGGVGVVEISMEIIALEPVVHYTYRGIQFQKGTWGDRGYVPTSSDGIVDISASHNFTDALDVNLGNRLVAFNGETNDMLVMYLNTKFGLGTFEHNASNNRFFLNATKGYSNMTDDGVELAVSENESLFWFGGYSFNRGLNYPGLGKAYVIYLNGKRIYCADDFYSRDGYIEVLPEDVNKQIKIIENQGYTTEEYTTSRGLKFSKLTGAGSIMFEVI